MTLGDPHFEGDVNSVCRAPVFEAKAELLAKIMSVLLVEVLMTLKNL